MPPSGLSLNWTQVACTIIGNDDTAYLANRKNLMSKIGQIERATQNRVVKLFADGNKFQAAWDIATSETGKSLLAAVI